MFREVAVIEVGEVLRAWLSGSGCERAGMDRNTVNRAAALAAADARACPPEVMADLASRPDAHAIAAEAIRRWTGPA